MKETVFEILSEIQKWITLILPIITFGSLIVPKIRKWIKRKLRELIGIQEIQDKTNEIQQEISSMKQQINLIETTLNNHLDRDKEKVEAQMYNLKDSLMRSFHFYINRGYITLEELNTLQDVYKSYRKFGGNGVFKALWENKILELPDKPPKE